MCAHMCNHLYNKIYNVCGLLVGGQISHVRYNTRTYVDTACSWPPGLQITLIGLCVAVVWFCILFGLADAARQLVDWFSILARAY
jgi:hypothetical protein